MTSCWRATEKATADVWKRFKLAVVACAAAASLVGCFSQGNTRRTSHVEPVKEKAFCEVTSVCAYARQGVPASHLIRLADESARLIRTVEADVSVSERLYEPVGDRSVRAAARQDAVRWTLDLKGRRYHLKRLKGNGSYEEGACNTETCTLLRRNPQSKIPFSATVASSSDQRVRDSVIEEETTVWWLSFLTLHREVTLANTPNLGEKRFSIWYGTAPDAASVADIQSVAEANMPPFGICQVVRIVFRQPDYRDAEMWLWLTSEGGWRAVRRVIYAKSTGVVVVHEILRGVPYAGGYFPTQMRECVYSLLPEQQNMPIEKRQVRLYIQRDINLEKVRVNLPVDESAFVFEVPMGTLVEDTVHNKVYVKQIARPSWLSTAVFVAGVLATLYIFWRLRQLLAIRRSA